MAARILHRRSAGHRAGPVSALCLAMVALCTDALPQDDAARREDQLKAAYVFNFVKFVEWPDAASGDTLTVCLVGGAELHAALTASMEGKKIGGHPLAVRRLQQLQEAAGCSVLYLEAAAIPEDDGPLAIGMPSSMLTVSDVARFTRRGGIIGLFTESNRLRFSVNVDNAQRAGLRISSNLLQLAARIDRGGSP